jgi:hypothetical protein
MKVTEQGADIRSHSNGSERAAADTDVTGGGLTL